MEQKQFDRLLVKFKDALPDAPGPAGPEFVNGIMRAVRQEPVPGAEPSVLDFMLDYAERFGFGLAAASVALVVVVFSRGSLLDQIPLDQALFLVG